MALRLYWHSHPVARADLVGQGVRDRVVPAVVDPVVARWVCVRYLRWMFQHLLSNLH